MYCLSCGTAVTPGLSYCKHCGARLNGAKDDTLTKSSEMKPETLVGGMVAVFVFGLGAIIGLVMALKMVFPERENLGLIIFFTLISFLTMLAIEGVFVWMLFRRKQHTQEATDVLNEAKAFALPEPTLSVTEHTTRSLDPVSSHHSAE